MSDLSATLTPTNLTGWAYDATRNNIDIVTSDGKFITWNIDLQAYTGTLSVTGTPGSVDVSPDGHFAVIGDSKPILTSDPFAVPKTYEVQWTRLNLLTGQAQDIRFAPGIDGGGVHDVAVTADGLVLVTTGDNGSNWSQLHSFQLGADSPVDGVVNYKTYITSSTGLSVSDSHRMVLMQEGDISDGPIHTFQSGQVAAYNDLYAIGTSGYMSGAGPGDINDVTGYSVEVSDRQVFVFDSNLKPVADLSPYDTGHDVDAAAFSADGRTLYLWQGDQSHVLALDTTSWKPVGGLSVGSTVGPPNFNTPYQMDVVDNGRVLVLNTGASLEVVDIPSRLNSQIAAETLTGCAETNTLTGGEGDDVISASGAGASLLRGGYGSDSLSGGSGFDDINGNQGNDTAHGNAGDDWVVGGKGDDVLFGDDGGDIVYGNIGNDTLDGGAGNDLVRGGQGDDVITGGDGDDWISGDLGSDTMTGGAGADVFHTWAAAGYDRVLDFHASEGDRVQLDPGSVYTVSQVGLDTVIVVGGQAHLTLVGVQMSSLPAGWIFGA